MNPVDIKRLIRRWYFASALTGYYVGSFETTFERQLTEIGTLADVDGFERYFEHNISALLTDDYFRITLPNDLDANGATGPTWQGFVAAQIVLGAKGLFSTAPLSQLLGIGSSGTKKAVDKHHIFPDSYLKKHGHLNNRSNRANFTYVDYPNNIWISDDAPSVYVPKYRSSMGEKEYARNCAEHALPLNFEDMDYEEFLKERRVLMAQLIKKGFETL